MDPIDLLRKVPTMEEWACHPDSRHLLATGDMSAITDAYVATYKVLLPAFDEDGYPLSPPREHILDAFARQWLAVGDATQRMEYGTVAVVAEQVECDKCGWGAARYETRVGRRRDFASLCLGCTSRIGDPQLGPGRSVLMLMPKQLPPDVLETIRPFIDPQQWPPWASDGETGEWAAYRRWGFHGPEDATQLYAVILDMQLSIKRGPVADSVELRAQRAGSRHLYAPGGDTHYAPAGLDGLDVRAFVRHVCKGEATPARRDLLDAYFAVQEEERDARALAALQRPPYDPYLRLDGHPICSSADREACEDAAASSSNPEVVAQLARRHPDWLVRSSAIGNSACPEGALLAAAAAGDIYVFPALLERQHLPSGLVETVVEQLLLGGRLEHQAADLAVRRDDFPERYLDPLVQRIIAEGPAGRIELAKTMHGAPEARRDSVHTALLRASKKIPSTQELITEVVGEVPDRTDWLVAHPEYRIRDLYAWYEAKSADEPATAPTEPTLFDELEALTAHP